MALKINEIFYSIQGESTWAGRPTVFVRTSGCNLRCHYCDTTYAYYEGEKRALAEILDRVRGFDAQCVCVTGGEPLAQPTTFELLRLLSDEGYDVSLETSGSIDARAVDARVKIIMDVKTPDSGAADSFLQENLQCASVNNEFKFVICSEADFEWSVTFCRQHKLFSKTTVLYSPAHQQMNPRALAEKMLERRIPARLQLQMHKYIWSADARGV